MLAPQSAKGHKGVCTPNVLPCRINHNGPVDASERYWQPKTDDDGKTTAYFRGRKLRGRAVKIPDGYRGTVLNTTDKLLPQAQIPREPSSSAPEEDEEDDEQPAEVKVAEEVASFDEIVVWGHDVLPDGTDDPYTRGVAEWIAFAETLHSWQGGDNTEVAKAEPNLASS
ncbi:hypothetical protein W97_00051 [Coniosporium apollinis CBS 100218]|uniref:Uncharacterized protein n=1 Tax=Coniosporium apollinis (strain CBS 100218) TaxID=1168221 RepID=R7YGQ3_CONA1|nr:uncharacterized protein W97_00051 [Coniosporium apollinis CBS 100218]EON60841.1 hypothetical protein W97_00051 [Coniosporium apollinis CBS 100218]